MAAFSSVRRFLITIISAAMRPSMTTPSTPTNTPTRVNIWGLSCEAFFPSTSETERGHTERSSSCVKISNLVGAGGGVYLLITSFIRRSSAPRSNPLIFYIAIFWEKRKPFRILGSCKWYTIHIPSLEFYIPLTALKFIKLLLNYKTRTFSWLFSQPYNVSACPFGQIEIT